MNNIPAQQAHPLYNHRPSIPEAPIGKPEEQVKQLAVEVIASKQQQQLAETYIKTTQQAYEKESSDIIQELAHLAKSHRTVQLVNDNDGEKMKSAAARKQQIVEQFYRNMQI